MKLNKAPAELVDLLGLTMEGIDCEKRLMFGFPAYFINKNMFAGLFEDRLFFRLSNEQLESLREKAGLISKPRTYAGKGHEGLLGHASAACI
jgi:TfoX/Sxy family transcriptional regulator of competence genes